MRHLNHQKIEKFSLKKENFFQEQGRFQKLFAFFEKFLENSFNYSRIYGAPKMTIFGTFFDFFKPVEVAFSLKKS